MAVEFTRAAKDPKLLKVFVNTVLDESWDDQGKRLDNTAIKQRREDWGDLAPMNVGVITASADVQDDRLEIEIVGWGRGEQSWSIAYHVLYGDPSTPQLWAELDELLGTPIEHEMLGEMRVHAACVDSGGHFTHTVLLFCRERSNRRIWAIRGVGGEGRPVWVRKPGINKKIRAPYYNIGVDSAKEVVYARLTIEEPGPGYCHFPRDRDDHYFTQLTAEEVITV